MEIGAVLFAIGGVVLGKYLRFSTTFSILFGMFLFCTVHVVSAMK